MRSKWFPRGLVVLSFYLGGCQNPTALRTQEPPPPVVVLQQALPATGPHIADLLDQLLYLGTAIKQQDWSQATAALQTARRILSFSQEGVLLTVPTDQKARAEVGISQLNLTLAVLETALVERNQPSAQRVWQQSLWHLATLRLALLDQTGWTWVNVSTQRGTFTLLIDRFNAPRSSRYFLQITPSITSVAQLLQREKGVQFQTSKALATQPLEIRDQRSGQILYDPVGEVQPALSSSIPGALVLRRSGAFEILLSPPREQVAVVGYVISGFNVIAKLHNNDAVTVSPLRPWEPFDLSKADEF